MLKDSPLEELSYLTWLASEVLVETVDATPVAVLSCQIANQLLVAFDLLLQHDAALELLTQLPSQS